ncbi:MAG: V-type ATPase subunit [Candidatus Hodarchaeales archaeon]|jgi:vacuolar-type H+-ATPase subunit C/Vma6
MRLGQVTEAKEYSFVNTRIKARKGQLLAAADYERLLSSPLIEGLIYLQDTPRYKESITSVDPNSTDFIKSLEYFLYENVYNEMLVLVKDTPEKARDLIEFYLKKSYITALKHIIRQIHTKELELLSSEWFIVTNSDEKTELALISKAESVEELIQKLQTPWVVEALKSELNEYQKQGNILLLENAIDHSYYKQIWEKVIPSQNKRDRKVTEKIIGMEIDLININIVLRSKLRNFPPKEIMAQLIPINYRLGSILYQAVEAYSFPDAIENFQTTVYSDLVQAIFREYREKDKTITKIEQLQQEWFIQALLTMMAGYPFHIGIFLAYIVFRLQETENLRIIFETKWKGIDLKYARDLLIYFK